MSNLVLWGHHVDDYQEMFALDSKEEPMRILEFGSGPSAFNSEWHAAGHQAVSCDPLFCLDKDTLVSKAALIFADMSDAVEKSADKFNFSRYHGLDGLIKKRQAGMQTFFDDYIQGKKEGRYFPLTELALPFDDFSFDLAISSHYLFGEIENQDLEFHIKVLKELARVAKEVRIFPLIDRQDNPSPFLGPVLLQLQQENYGTELRSVDYHLQPKGNAMLRIWQRACPLTGKAL